MGRCRPYLRELKSRAIADGTWTLDSSFYVGGNISNLSHSDNQDLMHPAQFILVDLPRTLATRDVGPPPAFLLTPLLRNSTPYSPYHK